MVGTRVRGSASSDKQCSSEEEGTHVVREPRRASTVYIKNALSHASHLSRDRMRHGATADQIAFRANRSGKQRALDERGERRVCAVSADLRGYELHRESIRALHRGAIEHVGERLGIRNVRARRDRFDERGEALTRELLERATQLG